MAKRTGGKGDTSKRPKAAGKSPRGAQTPARGKSKSTGGGEKPPRRGAKAATFRSPTHAAAHKAAALRKRKDEGNDDVAARRDEERVPPSEAPELGAAPAPDPDFVHSVHAVLSHDASGGRVRREGKGSILSPAQILARLGMKAAERGRVIAALRDLVAAGKAVALRDGVYARGPARGESIGRLRIVASGRSFIVFTAPLTHLGDTYREAAVHPAERDTAVGGDLVRVVVSAERDGGLNGRVTEVLERGVPFVVGVFRGDKRGGVLVPHGKRIDREVRLRRSQIPDALRDGQWAVAAITGYTRPPDALEGEITEVLGDLHDRGVDVTILLREHGCRERFPDDVEAEAAAFPARIPAAEIARRRDLRELLTFTIDGADAKDFDDAISIEPLAKNRWRLGVHIADVSHYVTEASALDREALDRSTSIYPLDRVVPMLPERLSNDLCSLRPREDRLAFTCFMDVDARGEVSEYEVCESVIHSAHRLTYEQVQAEFDRADAGERPTDALAAAWPALAEARTLARHLIAMKERRGALDLAIPEPQVLLDKDGRTVGITWRKRHEAHRLIEEFMTLCNEVVGRHMTRHKIPALYRVHDEPDPDAVERLAPILRGLNIPVSLRGAWGPKQIQAVLEKTETMESGHILRRLVLRSMQRAVYQPANIGHFGLGSECYLHFTSPIRRYPDLLVHRILRESLVPGGLPVARRAYYRDSLEELGRHTSTRERESMKIEYAVAELKALEYMVPFVGDEFVGAVSGIVARGAFIELEAFPVEGFVPVRSMAGFWDFDDDTLTLVQRASGKRLRIGQKMDVIVERVDPLAQKMDLRPADGGEGPHPARGAKGHRHGGRSGGTGSGRGGKQRGDATRRFVPRPPRRGGRRKR